MSISPEKLSVIRERIRSLSVPQRIKLREKLVAEGVDWHTVWSEEFLGNSVPVVDHDRPNKIPLTPSQSHVWVLHQLYPDLTAYHIAFTWRMKGDLRIGSLSRAMTLLVSEQPSLRTVFVPDDSGRPYQELLSPWKVEFDRVDVARVKAFVCEESAHLCVKVPFDLRRGPLFRIQLQRFSESDHALIFVFHHLIADGWSRGVLMRRLASLYNNQEEAAEDSGEIVKRAYSVFCADQEWINSEEHSNQLSYWKKQLADLAPLQLPADRKRPSAQTFVSHTLTRSLSLELRDGVHQLARQLGATPFMVVLTAFKLLLHRYTGRRDIAIGVPVSGRRYPECADLIGFFVNTIVVRSQFIRCERSTFSDCLRIVKATVIEGLEHQFVPFSQVVEAAAPARTSHQNPLFEIMFQLQSDGYRQQNSAIPDIQFDGLELTQTYLELPETKFDLTWHMIDREDGLLVAVEYRTALFDDDRIEQMLDHFKRVLEEVVRDPETTVDSLRILAPEERAALLDAAAGERVAKPNFTFIESFEYQVAETPDAISVRDESASLSYVGLDLRAEDVANELRTNGVRSDTIVSVELPRCIDQLVAVLGVMKTGAAFLPIDPTLPSARRQYMRDDGGCVASVRPGLKIVPSTTSKVQANRRGLSSSVYVIYTSGSTGKPKGTVITNMGLMNYLQWCTDHYPYDEGWGAPVHSSFGFDATITSMLGPLITGKTVHLLPEVDVLPALVQSMQTGPSLVKLTPAHLSAIEPLLPRDLQPEQLPKALVIGGEALTAEQVQFWRTYYPRVQLFNEYGPTETVVGSCVHRIDKATRHQGNLPIGRPISGTELYVLDEQLNLAPNGVPGELFISGHGVAQGYLHRPSLTAEKFLPNPFANLQSACGTVMYRTGDVVMRRRDGVLEYLGRTDNQVQLHGYRIELAEIEAVLRRHDAIEQCAVVCEHVTTDGLTQQGRSMSPRRLIAYVQATYEVTPDSLTTFLRSALPEYMVPRHFEFLTAIPLTHHGKIDVSSLPQVSLTQALSPLVTPRNETEARLHRVWQEVLGRDVGVEDNFFDRGGDSISGMQIIAGARREGLHLTPHQLFEHQTISAQAGVVQELDSTLSNVDVATGEVALSSIQRAFLQQDHADPHHFNQGVLLVIMPSLDFTRLSQAIQQMVEIHDVFRLRYAREPSGVWRQWFASDVGTIVVEDIDLRDAENFEVRLAKELSVRQTEFDLSHGPLFRAARFQGPKGQDRLMLLAHHLIVDGVTWRILLSDLAACWKNENRPTVSINSKSYREKLSSKEDLGFTVDSGKYLQAEARECFRRLSVPSQRLDEGLVLTAVAQTMKQFSKVSTFCVALESHGRDVGTQSSGFSDVLGWFSRYRTIRISLPVAGPTEQIDYVRKAIQVNQENCSCEVSFNFLGHLTAPSVEFIVGLAPEQIPDLISRRNYRWYPLEIVSWVVQDELQTIWRYDRLQYEEKTIERIVDRFIASVESLQALDERPKNSPPNGSTAGVDKLMAKLRSREKK